MLYRILIINLETFYSIVQECKKLTKLMLKGKFRIFAVGPEICSKGPEFCSKLRKFAVKAPEICRKLFKVQYFNELKF